jgi:hypothetical protein
MGSPATSRLRALDRDGRPLDAPLEWEGGFVEVAVATDLWEGAVLERDDRPLALSLRRFAGEPRVVAEWPRSGTGRYQLTLALPDGSTEGATWTIQPRKITPAAYYRMLEALEMRLPVSIALGLQRLGALTGIRFEAATESTLAQELARLRRAVDGSASRPGLAKILPLVARDPHRVLSSAESWVPRERARRINPSSLRQAVAAGANLAEDGLPWKLPEVRVTESVDVYENRILATFHEQVARRLRRLRSTLENGPSERLLRECDDLLERLACGRRESRFLDEVGQLSHRPSRLTMVLLKRPEYRYLLEGYLELHRSAIAHLEEPALEAPLEQLPALYETWGVLQVVQALIEVAAKTGFEAQLQRIVGYDAGGVFVRVLPDGRPALTLSRDSDGTRIRLVPQRSYLRRQGDYRSISYRQKPDVAIEVERAGERGRILLFDPKYKLLSDDLDGDGGRPKKVDIDTMHAYRDAIRDEEDRRVVEHASILYPGPTTSFGPGLGAIRAAPDDEEALGADLRRVLSEALG